MNITVEDVSSCKKRFKVELPLQQIQKAFQKTTRSFQKSAHLPGFRRGKAPEEIVQKKYRKEIEKETERTLLQESISELIKSQELKKIVVEPSVEDLRFNPTNAMSYTVVFEVEPSLSTPNYIGITVPSVDTEVPEEEFQKMIDHVQKQHGEVKEIAPPRPAAIGDLVLISFCGTIDGQPLKEVFPPAAHLAENDHQWLELQTDHFLTGFAEKIVGMNPGEEREIQSHLPQEMRFGNKEDEENFKSIAEKPILYQVTLKEMKALHLPEWNDAFCQTIAQINQEAFFQNIREEMKSRKEKEGKDLQKKAIIDYFLDQVDCELPEALVEQSVHQNTHQIVSENQARGIPLEVIKEKSKEIQENAQRDAQDEVKLTLIFSDIAEKENIQVEEQELYTQLYLIANREKVPFKKVAKQFKQTGHIEILRKKILVQKVLEYLLEQAKIQ